MTDPNGPDAGQIKGIEPHEAVSVEDAPAFNRAHAALRSPRQTKGVDDQATELADGPVCCDSDSGCC